MTRVASGVTIWLIHRMRETFVEKYIVLRCINASRANITQAGLGSSPCRRHSFGQSRRKLPRKDDGD